MAVTQSHFQDTDITLVRARTQQDIVLLSESRKQIIFINEQAESTITVLDTEYNLDIQIYLTKGAQCRFRMDQSWKGRLSVEIFLEEPYSSVQLDQVIKVEDIQFMLTISHRASFTQSSVRTKYLVDGGNLQEHIIITVPESITNCEVMQSVDVLQLQQSKLRLLPELRISSPTTKSRHSVAIHSIQSEQVFQLMSKGLSHEQSLEILQSGFLAV